MNSPTVATDYQQEVKEACDDSNGLESSDSNGLDNDDFRERYNALIYHSKGGFNDLMVFVKTLDLTNGASVNQNPEALK